MSEIITVKDLSKIYIAGENRIKALDHVSFTVEEGSFVAVIGTSGSGKSTLLNMLAGLEPPTEGSIVIAGEHIDGLDEAGLIEFRREHVGFVFQSYNLLPHMNGLENASMPLTIRGWEKAEREARAMEYLKMVGVEKEAYHMPDQMSGGQQQRVGIARAFVTEPQIIFADEPTGNLDSNTTREVLKLMKRMVEEKHTTLVMVTHDNNLAACCDVRIRIIDGHVTDIEYGAADIE